ncbi:MAG: arsenate reductase ArsC [Candidatus Eremiobacterota bacterium]
MPRVLVLCTHNSARSQMAEGWLRNLASRAGFPLEVWSAGTERTRVKPEVLQVMAEEGMDLTAHFSKRLEDVPDWERFDAVLTVCDAAARSCPVFPGETRRYHVSVPDPSGESLERWHEVRDGLRGVCQTLVDALRQGQWPDPDRLRDSLPEALRRG